MAPRTPLCASLVAQTMPTGSHLSLAESAVAECIAENPRTVDWFGVARALTEAAVRDVREGRS